MSGIVLKKVKLEPGVKTQSMPRVKLEPPTNGHIVNSNTAVQKAAASPQPQSACITGDDTASPARKDQGSMTPKRLSIAERIAASTRNVSPDVVTTSGSPLRKRKNPTPSPPTNSKTVSPVVADTSHLPSFLNEYLKSASPADLIAQALNFLATANIKTTHQDRNVEVTRAQVGEARAQVRATEEKVEALSAELVEVKDCRDHLTLALEKERAEKAELKKRLIELESQIGGSSFGADQADDARVNISYILAVVDVAKMLKEQAPDVNLEFLRANLKAYVACYPPSPGVVLDFGVLGTMDDFLPSFLGA